MSEYFATWLKSGEITTNFEPFARASEMKCTSGVRVMFRFAAIDTMYEELYQSAPSHTSVWSPHTSGNEFGRSAYQS